MDALQEMSRRTSEVLADTDSSVAAQLQALKRQLAEERAASQRLTGSVMKLETQLASKTNDFEALQRAEQRAVEDLADLRKRWRVGVCLFTKPPTSAAVTVLLWVC